MLCHFCVVPIRPAEELPLATRITLAARRGPYEPYGAGASRGSSGKSLQAQGSTPCAPRAGLCGRLAAGQTYQKPPGVPPSWGSRSRPNLQGGPPLGAFRRCVWVAQRPSPSCRLRSGESRRGKRMCSAAFQAQSQATPHARLASRGPRPSN